MANNFIEENNKNKLKKSLDFAVNQKEEVKWTEPTLENNEENKNISVKKEKENKEIKTPHSSEKKAKILLEKTGQSFFEKIFSGFKKKKVNNFQEQKNILSEHQKNINQEKENKSKRNIKDEKKYKDIGEVVKERLKENKIKISDEPTIKTNLMDGGPTILVDWKRNFLFLGFGLFIVALLIGLLYVFFQFKIQNESIAGEELDQEIKIIDMQIEKEKANLSEIDKLQKKLLISKNILDKHIYWTNFFKFLEDNTLENVYYLNGISGSTDGDYSFEALTDNYKNITEQLMVLRNSDLVLGAEVSEASLEEKKKKNEEDNNSQEKQIKFNLSLKLAPEIFYK